MFKQVNVEREDLLPPTEAPREDERPLPFTGHLEELRWRIWICVGALLLTTAGSFAWTAQLIAWLRAPAGAFLPTLAFLAPTEAFLAHVNVAVGSGVILSAPVVLTQCWRFVRPALAPPMQRWSALVIGSGSALFLGGVAFAYTVLLPVALKFLLTFGTPTLEPVISIGQYVSFVMTVLLASGLVFELPLVIGVLTAGGVLTPEGLRRQWRAAYLGIAVAAAFLTPTPDVVTMLLLMVPLLALYESSILLARVVARRRQGP